MKPSNTSHSTPAVMRHLEGGKGEQKADAPTPDAASGAPQSPHAQSVPASPLMSHANALKLQAMQKNLATNLASLERSGYQQLIKMPLPNLDVLRKVKDNKASPAEIAADPQTQKLIHNIRANAKTLSNGQQSVEQQLVKSKLDTIIASVEKLHRLIEEDKLEPRTEVLFPGVSNRVGSRLFLKDEKLCAIRYTTLTAEMKAGVTPKVENIHTTFGIVLTKNADGRYELEHRLGGPIAFSGHPSLLDDSKVGVVAAGEEFHTKGEHRINSTLTGKFHGYLKDLGITAEHEAGMLDVCLSGLGRTFYKVRLAADGTNIDYALYKKELDKAGAVIPGEHDASKVQVAATATAEPPKSPRL